MENGELSNILPVVDPHLLFINKRATIINVINVHNYFCVQNFKKLNLQDWKLQDWKMTYELTKSRSCIVHPCFVVVRYFPVLQIPVTLSAFLPLYFILPGFAAALY